MASLKGKVIAVSGGASGMGLATAKLLYSLGAKVSMTDNRKEALDAAVATVKAEPLAAGVGEAPPLFACVTDVRSSQEVDAWIEQTVATLGGLDGAANMAGVVGKHIGIHDVAALSDEEWAFVTDINLTGVFYAVRAQVRAMRKLPPGPRSIVSAASTAGISGNALNSNYTAAKHGVVGITRAVAKEVGRENIRVNAVAPYVHHTHTLSRSLCRPCSANTPKHPQWRYRHPHGAERPRADGCRHRQAHRGPAGTRSACGPDGGCPHDRVLARQRLVVHHGLGSHNRRWPDLLKVYKGEKNAYRTGNLAKYFDRTWTEGVLKGLCTHVHMQLLEGVCWSP